MLAKETALVLPVIVFASELICHGPAGAFKLRAWLRRGLAALAVITPYLALSAAYLGLRIMALRGFQNPREAHPVLNMVLTWPTVLWFYTRHLIWPVGLGPFYDMEYVAHPGVRNFLLPGLAVMLIAAVLAALAARSQKAALATLWLVVPILPVLNLRVFTEGHFAHDRYLYLPSVGFAMLVGMGLGRLEIGRAKLLGQPAIQVALAAVLALALGTATTEQSTYFANPNTFMTYAYSKSLSGEVAKLDLAGILGEQGYLLEAIKIYQELWQAHPESWAVNYNLGYACYLAGKVPEADRCLSRAVEIDAYRPEAFFYLGLTKLKMGDLNAAAANVERAVTLRPDVPHCHFALGVIFRLQGKSSAALAEFQKELDLDPDNASARQQAQEIVTARTKERH
jgi:tetratricopeptide (TPR) repeat protein